MPSLVLFDSEKNIAAYQLNVEPGFLPCGIEGNIVFFEKDGHGRKYELPFWDDSPCKIEQYFISTAFGEESKIHILTPHSTGNYLMKLSLEGSDGNYWVIIQAKKP